MTRFHSNRGISDAAETIDRFLELDLYSCSYVAHNLKCEGFQGMLFQSYPKPVELPKAVHLVSQINISMGA
jgi:hypothetical protein